ncbi:hypothetical protein LXL04_034160 [Taraxacum kok-saghyz]
MNKPIRNFINLVKRHMGTLMIPLDLIKKRLQIYGFPDVLRNKVVVVIFQKQDMATSIHVARIKMNQKVSIVFIFVFV